MKTCYAIYSFFLMTTDLLNGSQFFVLLCCYSNVDFENNFILKYIFILE